MQKFFSIFFSDLFKVFNFNYKLNSHVKTTFLDTGIWYQSESSKYRLNCLTVFYFNFLAYFKNSEIPANYGENNSC